MKTIWFCSSPDPNPPDRAEPDYVIHQFAELPQTIRFLAAP